MAGAYVRFAARHRPLFDTILHSQLREFVRCRARILCDWQVNLLDREFSSEEVLMHPRHPAAARGADAAPAHRDCL